ncbi:Protein of unknown function [Pseudidiomarina maritima]|uniref:Lcl C-terminal domain-containing protein n=2 Tax=Pseudidiomarina maritima TaxID=519453 RepID=A0A1I6H5H6_9GAMM|nr:Protein of unknown function [Pseudidiomarina maritima]
MKKLTYLSLMACVLSASSIVEASCKYESIQPNTAPDQFYDNRDGTVLDVRTGLTWSLCLYGQAYEASNNSCTGSPTAVTDWSEALNAQDDFNHGDVTDWRLPNIKELATLVEYACFDPAIRTEVFPETPSSPFWTNTPDAEDIDPAPLALGRYIDFYDGSEFNDNPAVSRFIRFVRTAE